jgi:hypothetical protein
MAATPTLGRDASVILDCIVLRLDSWDYGVVMVEAEDVKLIDE